MRQAEFKINYVPHMGQQEVRDGVIASGADVIIVDG